MYNSLTKPMAHRLMLKSNYSHRVLDHEGFHLTEKLFFSQIICYDTVVRNYPPITNRLVQITL